ncbi:MAG: STAS domain-containing protein [Chitinivibrionales bacterium]
METKRVEGLTEVRLSENVIGKELQELNQVIRNDLLEGVETIYLNFGSVKFIDSSAIGWLVKIQDYITTEYQGISSMVLKNIPDLIMQLFVDTNLHMFLNLENTGRMDNTISGPMDSSVEVRLRIKEDTEEGIKILKLDGVMNHPSGSRFFKRRFLLAMIETDKIVLDFTNLTFFDSISTGVILDMNKLLRETGGSMAIAGSNYIVKELFDTLNMERIVPMYNKAVDAINDLKKENRA